MAFPNFELLDVLYFSIAACLVWGSIVDFRHIFNPPEKLPWGSWLIKRRTYEGWNERQKSDFWSRTFWGRFVVWPLMIVTGIVALTTHDATMFGSLVGALFVAVIYFSSVLKK
ncbi:MAG: hypothetical protein ABL973_12540 [Micropepsaceae bacterium]